MKRRSMVAAAMQLFVSNGYHEVSMREVAERAGVSTRTLYNCYEDKVSLFNACLDSISASTPRVNAVALAPPPETPTTISLSGSDCPLRSA